MMDGTGPLTTPLPPGACQVWWATPSATPTSLLPALEPAEQEQFGSFRQAEDRARYLTAHTLVRIVLGARLALSPQEVRFSRRCEHCGGPHGKPCPDHPGSWQVSLSHSGDRVGVALAYGTPVGIDVEQIRTDINVESLMRLVCAPSESQVLVAWPTPDCGAAFFAYWTRKEAVLKATGHGLAVSPNKITVTTPAEHPRLLAWETDRPAPGPVRMHDLDPGAGYAACLAVLTDSALSVDELPADGVLAQANQLM